jgi:hypothetical protein
LTKQEHTALEDHQSHEDVNLMATLKTIPAELLELIVDHLQDDLPALRALRLTDRDLSELVSDNHFIAFLEHKRLVLNEEQLTSAIPMFISFGQYIESLTIVGSSEVSRWLRNSKDKKLLGNLLSKCLVNLKASLDSKPLETLCLGVDENTIVEELIYQRRASATLDTASTLFQALASSKIPISRLDAGLCSVPMNAFVDSSDYAELKDTLSSIKEMALSLTLSAFYDDQGRPLPSSMCEIVEDASDDETQDGNDEESSDDQNDDTDSNGGEQQTQVPNHLPKLKKLATFPDDTFRPHVEALVKFFEMTCNLNTLDLHWYNLRPRNGKNIPDSDEQQFFRTCYKAIALLPLQQCTLRGIPTKHDTLQEFIDTTSTQAIMLEEVYLISGTWTPILQSLGRRESNYKEIYLKDVQCTDNESRQLVWFKSHQCGLGTSTSALDRLSHIYLMGGLPRDLGWGMSQLGDMPQDKQLLWMYRRCAQFGISLNARYGFHFESRSNDQ